MRIRILITTVSTLATLGGFAQENFATVVYPVAIPTGDLHNYIGSTCWRGLTLGFRHLVNDNVAVGMDLSGHTFFERKDQATYTFETTSITGVQYRYLNTISFAAKADYVLNAGGDLRPFIGMGVGGMYAHRDTNFGLYELVEDPWQFIMQPEAGVSYYLSEGTALLVGADYTAGFDTKQLKGQTYLNVNIGLVIANF